MNDSRFEEKGMLMITRESPVRKNLMFLSIMRVWEMLIANACFQNEPYSAQGGTGEAGAPCDDEWFSPAIDDEGYNHQDFLASMRQISRNGSQSAKGNYLNFSPANLLS